MTEAVVKCFLIVIMLHLICFREYVRDTLDLEEPGPEEPHSPSLISDTPTPPISRSSSVASDRNVCSDIASALKPRNKAKRRKLDRMSTFESSFLELAQAQSLRLDRKQERHPLDAFFESCALRAKQLSREKQSWLQLQISMIMYNAESNAIMPQSGYTHAMNSFGYPIAAQNIGLPSDIVPQSVTPPISQEHGFHRTCMSTCSYENNPMYAADNQTEPQSGLDILSAAMGALE